MRPQTSNCRRKRGGAQRHNLATLRLRHIVSTIHTSVRARVHSCRHATNEIPLPCAAGPGPRRALLRGGVVAHAQRNTKSRAGPPRESPAGFRIASPLHKKKETPGRCRRVSGLLFSLRRGIWQALVRNTPVPQGTKDNSPVRFRGRACALRNKCRVSKTNSFLAPQARAQRSGARIEDAAQRSGPHQASRRHSALKPIPVPQCKPAPAATD
jgi:hypothetical protein